MQGKREEKGRGKREENEGKKERQEKVQMKKK